MKQWFKPTLSIISRHILSSYVATQARSLKCEKAHVR